MRLLKRQQLRKSGQEYFPFWTWFSTDTLCCCSTGWHLQGRAWVSNRLPANGPITNTMNSAIRRRCLCSSTQSWVEEMELPRYEPLLKGIFSAMCDEKDERRMALSACTQVYYWWCQGATTKDAPHSSFVHFCLALVQIQIRSDNLAPCFLWINFPVLPLKFPPNRCTKKKLPSNI